MTINLTSTIASGFLYIDFELIKAQLDGLNDTTDLNTLISTNTAKETNATHTGEVTGATALTIADNIVDEANMKISNAPTNDQVLTADSAVTGGWKWAAGGISEVKDDTTPELGGELDCGAHSIGFTLQTTTGDGTTTIDWKLGNKFKFTFGAQNDTFTFTAPSNPCSLTLVLVQDGTGSRTATFPATVKWAGGTAPTLTTTASAIDIISLLYDGTNYYGSSALAFS